MVNERKVKVDGIIGRIVEGLKMEQAMQVQEERDRE